MNKEEFEQVFDYVFTRSQATLVEKAREYAEDTDRLHNFKVAAALEGRTPEQALWGMHVKHIVSVSDMVRKDEEVFNADQWDEKIGDAINYFILLRALVWERASVGSDEIDPENPDVIDYQAAESPMRVQLHTQPDNAQHLGVELQNDTHLQPVGYDDHSK
jgi:hypothetical protein